MAKKLDEFPRQSRNSKYDWDTWLNGEVWELTRGEDFDIGMASFRSVAFREARLRKVKLRTTVRGGKFILQAKKESDD